MRLVVIDTNVWVSAFLNRKGFPARIKDAWVNGEFEVVLSSLLLQEISEVLHRPRIKDKYGLVEGEIAQFIELLLRRAVLVAIGGQVKLCRDEDRQDSPRKSKVQSPRSKVRACVRPLKSKGEPTLNMKRSRENLARQLVRTRSHTKVHEAEVSVA